MKMVLYKTLNHFFPSFNSWLKSMDDPRNQEAIEYPFGIMIWTALLLFILKLGSRRQINYQLKDSATAENIPHLAKEAFGRIAHHDTLSYLLCRLAPKHLAALKTRMIKRLLRMRALERYRLRGHYLIAVDATGYMKFNRRHCDYCLKMSQGEKVIYYHLALEVKLVTNNGIALSMQTEFIENQTEDADIQDCELRAFYRLAKKLKEDFPQLKICLLLDALYANGKVFDICRKNNWKYIITFKKGSMPATYAEYETLKNLNKENRAEYEAKALRQNYAWVNDIEYQGHLLNVFECREAKKKKEKTHVWVTNFRLDGTNARHIADDGGRLRWQIEEAFNIQKNGGYNLKHPYSRDITGSKNFYLLMQIAHIINQLMEKGNLLGEAVKKLFGSLRNFSRRLLEDLRTNAFNPADIEFARNNSFQIRLHGP